MVIMDWQTKREFKNQIYDQFARICKALGNGRRLELLDLLAQGECSVEKLARETGMSMANASQHLQILRAAQLVGVRREGQYIYYRLADEEVYRVWQQVRGLAESRLAQIDRVLSTYLKGRQELEPIDLTELQRRIKDNNIFIIDVRPREEYDSGHIPHAQSIPLDELEEHLTDIPKDQEIVAYCRGPYCIFSDEAVSLLRSHGREAYRLEQGLPEWRAMGFPVERVED